ncbi:MAG: hypothetical protein RIT43_1253 [Bacteroidota bacterium]|jgi:hypothetical protein
MKTKNIFSAILGTVLSTSLFAQGITLTSEMTTPACYGEFTGSISVTPVGGTGPYSYYWSTRDNLATANGLSAGEYTVIVVDANGNSVTETFQLTQPAPVTIEGIVTKVSTWGGSNGAIDLTVTGLTPSYTLDWATLNGSGLTQGQMDQTGLSAGQYTVTIVTEGNCVNKKQFTVTQKPPVFFNPNVVNEVGTGGTQTPAQNSTNE